MLCYRCKSALREVSSYCRPCYNAYMRDVNARRYAARRAAGVEALGGKCVGCSTENELEFDHVDPSEKEFNLGSIWKGTQARIDAELQKCVLRCHSCHVAKSVREGDVGTVGHGEGQSGKKNCSCELCAARKAEYMRNYMRQYRQQKKADMGL